MSYDGKALVTRPLAGNPKASDIVLVHRTGRRLSPAAERFADICRKRLKG
ncbi:LysR substrate-binding domain-containing protein [Roseovarius sp. M141]|nr:LysR substrate-binding domain-containing protein [Roseovarius sp. M141]